jgi:Xaa-Pro aminopeptidase
MAGRAVRQQTSAVDRYTLAAPFEEVSMSMVIRLAGLMLVVAVVASPYGSSFAPLSASEVTPQSSIGSPGRPTPWSPVAMPGPGWPLPSDGLLAGNGRPLINSSSVQMPGILTLREQATIYNGWLKTRLETVLPELMQEEGIDMWLVICRENNEDPVYFSLVPFTTLYASRLQILVFHRGADGFERFSVNFRQMGQWYKSVWDPAKTDQWTALANAIKERNPKVIGINESELDNYGDGLTASLKARLVSAIGPEYAKRLKSAERLAVRLLERRLPEEIEVYHQIAAIGHAIIAEAFSNQVITPGVTTTEDVIWWFRERSRQLGFVNWFQPSMSIQRPKNSPHKDSNVIQRGDLLHCDFGIVYMRLCTDTQQHAYVLKIGETDAPQGLKDGLRQGNRLQDIHMEEMKIGRTGNQILATALKRAKDEGLRPSIYSHPLGVHGHAAGTPVGMVDKQDGVPGEGDYPLFADTGYSIELNIRTNVPEWDNQEVRIALEQDAVVTKTGAVFLDRRQTAFHLIR